MKIIQSYATLFTMSLVAVLSSCSTYKAPTANEAPTQVAVKPVPPPNYATRIPQKISTNGHRVVVIDPNVHVWGAYDSNGDLVRAGLATAGGNWCPDIHRACHTRAGTFHVQSLGAPSCKSTIYPLPKGGAPMPYCMFFNGNQGMHGSPNGAVVEGNVSHGCVRMHVEDAEWLRYNFVSIGTKVVVKPY